MNRIVFLVVSLAVSICGAQHPSACRIGTEFRNGMAAGGSGCLVALGNGLGLVLTAAHVVEGERIGAPIYCEFPGRPKVQGSLAAVNEQSDAAVILVDSEDIPELKPVPWYEGSVDQGMGIWSDGWPASRYSRITGRIIATTANGFAFRTTAVPWEGHSGGPVFSQDGRIMGLVSARYQDDRGLGGIVYRVGPIRSWLMTLGWRIRRARAQAWQYSQIGYCPGGGCEIMPYGPQQQQPGPEYAPQAPPYGSNGGGGGGSLYVEPPIGVDPNAKRLPPISSTPPPSDSDLKAEIEELRRELERQRDNRQYIPPLESPEAAPPPPIVPTIPEEYVTEPGLDEKLDELRKDLRESIRSIALGKAAEVASGAGLDLKIPGALVTAFGIGGPPAVAIMIGAWMLKNRPVTSAIRRRREARRVPFDQPASRPAQVPGTDYTPAARADNRNADHDEEEIVEDYIERRPAVVERPFRRRTIVQRGPERVTERQDSSEERPVGEQLRRAAGYVGRPKHFDRVRPQHWQNN